MTKTVLLTGGFGNIGGRFSSFIADTTDYKIRLTSRQSRSVPSWAKRATAVTCDLTQPDSLDVATAGVDTIFHFASLNDRECAADPDFAYRVNVTGTENIVRSAVQNGVKRIIYMSTIHVYGSPLVGRITEASPTNPTHPYGLTHLQAELVLRSASSDIQSVVIRSGNGFGYPMSPDVDIWHIIVNDLCLQAVRRQTLTLRSPSNVERNFITLADICRGLLHLDNDDLNLGSSTTFNLGSRQSKTLRQMADLVAQRCSTRLGMSIDVVESVPETAATTSLDFDTSSLRSTGFATREDFEAEVDGILDMVRSNHDV